MSTWPHFHAGPAALIKPWGSPGAPPHIQLEQASVSALLDGGQARLQHGAGSCACSPVASWLLATSFYLEVQSVGSGKEIWPLATDPETVSRPERPAPGDR